MSFVGSCFKVLPAGFDILKRLKFLKQGRSAGKIGNGVKIPALDEQNTAKVARKSLAAAMDIPEGKILTQGDVTLLRPGTGLKPNLLKLVLGRTARRTIPAGQLIEFGDLA